MSLRFDAIGAGVMGADHARIVAEDLPAADLQVVCDAADRRPRFAEAYRLQNKAWIKTIEAGKPSSIAAHVWDGYCAALVAEAAFGRFRKVAKSSVSRSESRCFTPACRP